MCREMDSLWTGTLVVVFREHIVYIKNVESRDSEEGEAGRPKGSPPIVATYSHSWKRSSASDLVDQMKYLYIDTISWPRYYITTTHPRVLIVCQFNYCHTIAFFKCNIVYTKYEPKLIP